MSRKVVLMLIDGLGLETFLSHCGYLESLVAAGRARRWTMEAVLPTLSVPIYETLHSGIEPHEHGITTNARTPMSRSEHVFKVARRHGRKTAAVASYSFSELYNASPYDPARDHEVDDPALAIQHGRFFTTGGKTRTNPCLMSEADLMAKATGLARRAAPDYLLVHSESCDTIAHLYGGRSSEYRAQAAAVDDQLAQSVPQWQALGYRVLVTADHGMDADGQHGGTDPVVRQVAFYDLGPACGGIEPQPASQLSVAPTILNLLDLPVPEAMRAPALVDAGAVGNVA
ncbi:MAG: alkaline phosphatase family protein [Alphaproteobacteria bacterium]|nr:MAG: alkaline phosphatase family protein [Alphaproteobacteria bacterium]